jgi:hypothetical protein
MIVGLFFFAKVIDNQMLVNKEKYIKMPTGFYGQAH